MRRAVWVRIHRYIGLSLGLLFCLSGLTGSVIVFDHAIDEWLNPDLLMARGEGKPSSLQGIIDAAAAATGATPVRVAMPRRPGRAHVVTAIAEARDASEGTRVVEIGVNPAGPEVLGIRPEGEHLTAVIYDLHHTLLAGRTGEIVLGIAAIFLFVSLIVGICLWWPGRRKLGRALVVKRGAAPIRVMFDLHRTSGIYAAVVLLVVVFTGVYLVFADDLKALVASVTPVTPIPTDLASNPEGHDGPLSLDEAVAAAARVFPAGEVKVVFLPRSETDVYRIAVRQPGEVRRSGALSGVAVDRYDGEVLAAIDSRQATAADTVLAWQFPLHNGEAFGLTGRIIVFVSGLVPTALYVTGAFIWLRKRRSRRLRKQKSAAGRAMFRAEGSRTATH